MGVGIGVGVSVGVRYDEAGGPGGEGMRVRRWRRGGGVRFVCVVVVLVVLE